MFDASADLRAAVNRAVDRVLSSDSGLILTLMMTGSREYNDPARLWDVCTYVKHEVYPITLRGISGGARGADREFEAWCNDHDVPHQRYPADWKRHHAAAGPIRNTQMVTEGRPDLGLAFGMVRGSGTEDATEKLKLAGIPVWVDGPDFTRDRLRLESGQILQHHPSALCSPPCSIHNPSLHHMRDWPRRWFQDRQMICRVCVHGIPHPDPDDLLFRSRIVGEQPELFWEGLHYCPCHCCNTPTYQGEITNAAQD